MDCLPIPLHLAFVVQHLPEMTPLLECFPWPFIGLTLPPLCFPSTCAVLCDWLCDKFWGLFPPKTEAFPIYRVYGETLWQANFFLLLAVAGFFTLALPQPVFQLSEIQWNKIYLALFWFRRRCFQTQIPDSQKYGKEWMYLKIITWFASNLRTKAF